MRRFLLQYVGFLRVVMVLSFSQDPRCVPNGLQRIAARVAYDGTDFRGFQIQSGNARTVQGEIERALGIVLQRETRIMAASRTDTGVHARGQAIHFDIPTSWCTTAENDDEAGCRILNFKLNQLLPPDLMLWNVSLAPLRSEFAGFEHLPWHSMICSTGKVYSYRWRCARHMTPLDRRDRSIWYKGGQDIGKLEDSLSAFEGTRDFASFANRLSHKQAMRESNGFEGDLNTRRTVRKITLSREGIYGEIEDYRLDFELDGALYKMVRNIVGCLFDLSSGVLSLENLEDIFERRDRMKNPSKAAPAAGLTLEHVYYDLY